MSQIWWEDIWERWKVTIFALGDKNIFLLSYGKYGTLSIYVSLWSHFKRLLWLRTVSCLLLFGLTIWISKECYLNAFEDNFVYGKKNPLLFLSLDIIDKWNCLKSRWTKRTDIHKKCYLMKFVASWGIFANVYA